LTMSGQGSARVRGIRQSGLTPDSLPFREEIRRLREKSHAFILAHSYQPDEIQELADTVGDSLALSRAAAESPHPVIVFCGVRFMAESAKILSPQKQVLLPAPEAGCPLADFAEPAQVRQWRRRHPRAAVVAYINSSAAVKAEADICCTSANAVRVVASLEEKEIIFLPDRNLGSFVADRLPEKTVHIWPGHCPAHDRLTPEQIRTNRRLHPRAEVLAHPECRSEVVAQADLVGSTAQILTRVRESPAGEFIIATESGVLPGLRRKYPEKKFYLPSPDLFCPDMKLIGLEKLADALRNRTAEISVPEEVAAGARRALERMLAVS